MNTHTHTLYTQPSSDTRSEAMARNNEFDALWLRTIPVPARFPSIPARKMRLPAVQLPCNRPQIFSPYISPACPHTDSKNGHMNYVESSGGELYIMPFSFRHLHRLHRHQARNHHRLQPACQIHQKCRHWV